MGSITIIVIGVLGFSALLAWVMLRGMISAERSQRDPRYHRRYMIRLLIFQSGICAAGAAFCVVQFATRQPPQQIISSLFMVLMNLLIAIRAVRNLKTPTV